MHNRTPSTLLQRVRFSFYFDALCWICFSGCVCAFLVSRLAFVAICFSLRVFHNWTVMRFSSHLAFVALVFLLRACVSRFAWPERVGLGPLCWAQHPLERFAFRVSRFAFLVSLWHLLFVSRCAYFRISYHNGVVERAIELLRVSRLTLWHLLLVFRVTCFAFLVLLWHLWQFFSRYAYVFLVSLWHLTMIRSCARWIFKELCKTVCKNAEPMLRKMVAVRDVCVCVCVCICVRVYVCGVVIDSSSEWLMMMEDCGRGRWLCIQDPRNSLRWRWLFWNLLSLTCIKNFVQPAMGVVLHGWAYYWWLGGHYRAWVYPCDIVLNPRL